MDYLRALSIVLLTPVMWALIFLLALFFTTASGVGVRIFESTFPFLMYSSMAMCPIVAMYACIRVYQGHGFSSHFTQIPFYYMAFIWALSFVLLLFSR